MKEIVVISGKGGTGKTSITASFALLAGERAVVADCDVDAADMHLLLGPDFADQEAFFSGQLATIDPDICLGCGECADVCRFDAIAERDQVYAVDPLGCEGCGYCARVCPAQAITNVERKSGDWFLSTIKTGSRMVHARLGIGADNSGKLVAKVKSEAKRVAEAEGKPIVLVDGAPGIGCPVVSSLSGASFAVLVTEPTVSGIHDLLRVYQVVDKFGIPAGCIINKADLNPDMLEELRASLACHEIPILAELPYDEAFTAALTNGRTVVEWSTGLREKLERCWAEVERRAGIDPEPREATLRRRP